MNDAPPPGPGMHDYWLRGDSEAAVMSALAEAEISPNPTPKSSFDPIGTIFDADGNPIPGWHANLRMRNELTPEQHGALDAMLIPPPTHPVRIWG